MHLNADYLLATAALGWARWSFALAGEMRYQAGPFGVDGSCHEACASVTHSLQMNAHEPGVSGSALRSML